MAEQGNAKNGSVDGSVRCRFVSAPVTAVFVQPPCPFVLTEALILWRMLLFAGQILLRPSFPYASVSQVCFAFFLDELPNTDVQLGAAEIAQVSNKSLPRPHTWALEATHFRRFLILVVYCSFRRRSLVLFAGTGGVEVRRLPARCRDVWILCTICVRRFQRRFDLCCFRLKCFWFKRAQQSALLSAAIDSLRHNGRAAQALPAPLSRLTPQFRWSRLASRPESPTLVLAVLHSFLGVARSASAPHDALRATFPFFSPQQYRF